MARVLFDGRILNADARRSARWTSQTLSARFRQALHQLATRPRVIDLADGEVVLLIDGLWFEFRGEPWVVYLVAVKPVAASQAVFLDPVVIAGRENVAQWAEIFARLPVALRSRVRAVISDNLRGITQLIASCGWVSQLCHFHFISQLQGSRGRQKHRLADRPQRERIYQLARCALELPEGPRLATTLQQLHAVLGPPLASRRLRMVVREFLRRVEAFRAYQRHPDLQLPTTTGAVEAMGRVIRAALYRARNVRTPHALQLWVTALVRLRPVITCNGRWHQPN